MKVSVIIPFYNVESYIRKCLQSLQAQTLQDIEFLLINDGSLDNSESIVKEFLNDVRFKLFVKANGGLSDARNFGVRKACGKYIAYLDSDDYIEPTTYEKLYDKAIQTDADIVECNFIWEYPNKHIIDNNLVVDNLLLDIRVVAWNKLYKASFLKPLSIFFSVGYQYEDVSYCYKVLAHSPKLVSIEEPLIHYVQRKNSISNKQNEKVRDIFAMLKESVDYYKTQGMYPQFARELEYLHIRFLLGSSFKRIIYIADKNLRNQILHENWDTLWRRYPHWKQNHYLQTLSNKKNTYFKLINKPLYMLIAKLLRIRFHIL
ncbi:MAG: glycosyltransferase family 2 protein [Breznakia sp.]